MSPLRLVALLATLLTAATTAGAHDFWLIPVSSRVSANSDLVVHGQTSSAFPTTLSAVTPDRLTEARVVGALDDERIVALSTHANSLVLRHRPKAQGQKLVAVSVGWRQVKETADSFRKYLVAEGAEHALTHYDKSGQLPTSDIVRRYAKYGKTVVEFGSGPRAFDRVLGQPLEFVPLTDPAEARVSSELRVRLLFQGKPLTGARIHAGRAGEKGEAPQADATFTSSNDGDISIPITGPGLWNVRTIHVVPAPAGADANWDVHWSTFVFNVLSTR
ncbi:MAG TPA: DUF4198 domain-containing protein [Vicinamibacterales bacterium]|nr:DUF4198 domain-containing protein [Vicinamibacterales bacterium]